MSHVELQPSFGFQRAGKGALVIERECLTKLDQYINRDFTLACKKMPWCKEKVIVVGMGKSGHIGRKITATSASTGTPSFFIHPGKATYGDLGMVTPQDVMVAISNSDESSEIATLIPVLRRLYIPLICITDRPEGSMVRVVDVHLHVKVAKETCPLGLTLTSNITAMSVMGDTLTVTLLKARGSTAENFTLLHLGSAPSRKLLPRVSDIMHMGDGIPHIKKTAGLRDALLEATCKNLGMAVIYDNNMVVEDIFTDGNLRRVFDMSVNARRLSIADVMTSGEVRVCPDALAVEVPSLIQSRHITSMMVADDDRLLGMLRMHDPLHVGIVWRFKDKQQ